MTLIPGATLLTLKELVTEVGYARHSKHFDDLDPIVAEWLQDRLFDKNSAITRGQSKTAWTICFRSRCSVTCLSVQQTPWIYFNN
jgi:hypothetical protein